MTVPQALDIIVERRGTMYDPSVVDTFLRVHHEIAAVAPPQPELQNAVRRIRRAHAASPREAAASHSNAGPASPDSSEELLAFVRLARVASRTPTVADVGALAWSHLRHLAPGASLALYTADAGREMLVAQFTAGPAAQRLAGCTIAVGERVTGWVAANWRAMVNCDARLDLTDRMAEDLRFALAMPLVSDGVLVGVMTLYAPEMFADEGSRKLEIIAPHLATSIGSAISAESHPAASATEATRVRAGRPELRVVARR